MNIDMDHDSHAEMTVECKRLGCSKKTINDRIAKVNRSALHGMTSAVYKKQVSKKV